MIVALSLFLAFVVQPRTEKISALPEHIDDRIPLYDVENMDSMTMIEGKKRGRGVEVLGYIPKVVLAPLVVLLDIDLEYASEPQQNATSIDQAYKVIQTPLSDQRDIYTISWTNLDAEPDFIADFYVSALKRNDFTARKESTAYNTHITQVVFHDITTDGFIIIDDDDRLPGTDAITLTLYIPAKQTD